MLFSPNTPVDPQFRGTSYQAANWTCLGETRGRARMDQHHVAHGRAVKRIYIYPLCRNLQRRLAQDSAPRWLESSADAAQIDLPKTVAAMRKTTFRLPPEKLIEAMLGRDRQRKEAE